MLHSWNEHPSLAMTAQPEKTIRTMKAKRRHRRRSNAGLAIRLRRVIRLRFAGTPIRRRLSVGDYPQVSVRVVMKAHRFIKEIPAGENQLRLFKQFWLHCLLITVDNQLPQPERNEKLNLHSTSKTRHGSVVMELHEPKSDPR